WKGVLLPYRIFDPAQQRVTHAAISENKRHGDVRAFIKAQAVQCFLAEVVKPLAAVHHTETIFALKTHKETAAMRIAPAADGE
ncbi:hypothetical protein PAF17_15405, partial [Paracoccus sp. Z330]|nr:hypothetical protein [Paracoccus onchidii]